MFRPDCRRLAFFFCLSLLRRALKTFVDSFKGFLRRFIGYVGICFNFVMDVIQELAFVKLASLSMDISEGPSGLLQAADMVMRVKAIRSMRKFEVIAA